MGWDGQSGSLAVANWGDRIEGLLLRLQAKTDVNRDGRRF